MFRGPFRSLLGLLLATVVAVLLTALLPGGRKLSWSDPTLPVPRLEFDADGALRHGSTDGAEFRYTTDGSLPTVHDPELPQAAHLEAGQAHRLLHTPTSVQWRHPWGDLPKGLSVRVAAFQGDAIGPVATLSRPPMVHGDLPVVMITLPEGALMDPDTGIYVVGNAVLRDDPALRASYQRANRWWRYPGNFHGRGKAWERAAHLEFFPPGAPHASWAADVRLRVNGNNTRGFAQRALRVTFPEPLRAGDPFSDGPGEGRTAMILRASGNDQDRAFLRDGLQHRLCAALPFGTSAMRPCVVYINGAYWGVHDIRERLDDREIARRHGIPRKQVTILADGLELYDGDPREVRRFADLLTAIERWDPHGKAFVDSLERHLDVEGFLCYMSAQIILGNLDWPAQNVRWWRSTGPADTATGPRDGRWRMLMGDSDIGMGLNTGPELDQFQRLASSPAPVARLWRACLRSPELRERWARGLEQLLDGPLCAERMKAEAQRMRDAIAAEMPRQVGRWRRPLTIEAWNAHVDHLVHFAEQRPAVVRAQLERMALSGAGTASTTTR